MRLVMLDPKHLELAAIAPQRMRDSILYRRKNALRPQSGRGIRRHPEPVPCLPEKTRPWIARDGKCPDLTRLCSRGVNHVPQRLGGKACTMLDAVEAFFFGGGDQATISDECCTRIGVVRVYSDDSIHDCYYSVDTNFERTDGPTYYHFGLKSAGRPRKR